MERAAEALAHSVPRELYDEKQDECDRAHRRSVLALAAEASARLAAQSAAAEAAEARAHLRALQDASRDEEGNDRLRAELANAKSELADALTQLRALQDASHATADSPDAEGTIAEAAAPSVRQAIEQAVHGSSIAERIIAVQAVLLALAFVSKYMQPIAWVAVVAFGVGVPSAYLHGVCGQLPSKVKSPNVVALRAILSLVRLPLWACS
jgi:Flp pilus assembly protein TadB